MVPIKAAGKYRQEGGKYVVQDGDIIHFQFSEFENAKGTEERLISGCRCCAEQVEEGGGGGGMDDRERRMIGGRWIGSDDFTQRKKLF
jgi:hypothetical protein